MIEEMKTGQISLLNKEFMQRTKIFPDRNVQT